MVAVAVHDADSVGAAGVALAGAGDALAAAQLWTVDPVDIASVISRQVKY